MKDSYIFQIIAGLIGWVWIGGVIFTIYSLVNAIFWDGSWLIFLAAIVGTSFLKTLAKNYSKASNNSLHEYYLKIIHDYGFFLETTKIPLGMVSDDSVLPHPKEEIKKAIQFMLRITNNSNELNVLKHAYLELPYFQPNIGTEPLGFILPDTNNIDEAINAISNHKDIPFEIQEKVDQELLEIKQELAIV